MKTIRITRCANKEFKIKGRLVRYVPASLMGTVSETVALRVAAGGLPSSTALRAPGDWPAPCWML